ASHSRSQLISSHTSSLEEFAAPRVFPRDSVPSNTTHTSKPLREAHISCALDAAHPLPWAIPSAEDVMFDLFTGKIQHVPSTPAIPILVSTSIQGTALAVIALMSFLVASRELPAVPDVLAFVADMPAAAAPPPPPPPPAQASRPAAPKAVPPPSAFAAPVEAPREIAPEPVGIAIAEVGVPGGVEGG